LRPSQGEKKGKRKGEEELGDTLHRPGFSKSWQPCGEEEEGGKKKKRGEGPTVSQSHPGEKKKKKPGLLLTTGFACIRGRGKERKREGSLASQRAPGPERKKGHYQEKKGREPRLRPSITLCGKGKKEKGGKKTRCLSPVLMGVEKKKKKKNRCGWHGRKKFPDTVPVKKRKKKKRRDSPPDQATEGVE